MIFYGLIALAVIAILVVIVNFFKGLFRGIFSIIIVVIVLLIFNFLFKQFTGHDLLGVLLK